MTYQEALEIVEREFQTRYEEPQSRVIKSHLTYDGVNGIYIEICDEDGEILLTDNGITKDVFFEATDEAEWKALCEPYGFAFRHWHIERRFTGINDVYEFIELLMRIADKYAPLEDFEGKE